MTASVSGSGRYENAYGDSRTPAPRNVAPTGMTASASTAVDDDETHDRAYLSALPITGNTTPNEHAM
jgi:hypothetical protein|tara:strand:- start:755 stop:955 length:201 start_codon:yes stop_codon:yes gene_type:complete